MAKVQHPVLQDMKRDIPDDLLDDWVEQGWVHLKDESSAPQRSSFEEALEGTAVATEVASAPTFQPTSEPATESKKGGKA